MEKLKQFISTTTGKITALAFGVVGSVGLYSNVTYAAVDADIASTTSDLSSTLKENVMGVLTNNLSVIVLPGITIIAIFFIWRLFKRFIKG